MGGYSSWLLSPFDPIPEVFDSFPVFRHKNMPGSSYIFLAPDLESAISLRTLILFHGNDRDHSLDVNNPAALNTLSTLINISM